MYNPERPHEAVDLRPPVTRYRPSARVFPETLPVCAPCPGDRPIRVTEGGRLRVHGGRWYLGDAWDQEFVGLRSTGKEGVLEVRFGPYVIGVIDAGEASVRVRLVPLGRSAPSLHEPDADEPHLSGMSPNGVSHVPDRNTDRQLVPYGKQPAGRGLSTAAVLSRVQPSLFLVPFPGRLRLAGEFQPGHLTSELSASGLCGARGSMDRSSPETLACACDGDPVALAALLEAHTPLLAATLRSQIPDRWRGLVTVEDVLQETYTDAFLSVRGFVSCGDGAFAAWLSKLAQNNLLEAIRSLDAEKRGGGKRPMSIGIGNDVHTGLMNVLLPAATQTTPSQHVTREENRLSLNAALAELPPHYRLAVQRYDLEGRSIDETAAELDCSPGGVHMFRHRAFKQLRSLLAGRSIFSRPRA